MRYTWQRTGDGPVDNLGYQMQKVIRSMNENRYSTRHRYIEAEKRFISFAASEFRLQKLANIKDNHLEKYVEHLRDKGSSDKYIKNELSGIRFFHNHTPDTRHELQESRSFNRSCGLGSTPDIRSVDRAWTDREVDEMKNKAESLGKSSVADVIECMRATGTRIDEAVTLRYNQIEKSLENGILSLENTKGGIPREVPLTERARELFEKKLEEREDQEEYAFTPSKFVEDKEIHAFKKSVQNFIYNHRDDIQEDTRADSGHNVDSDSEGALTAHGLRHAFAREQYETLVDAGHDDPLHEVAEMLGHHRKEITLVYLGSLSTT